MKNSHLDAWMRNGLLPLPALGEAKIATSGLIKRWVHELPAASASPSSSSTTGELRVGVSRLQVVKALAEVAGASRKAAWPNG